MSEFLDAQLMHKENPDTFWAPSQEELDTLHPGHYVKICENNERFWIELDEVDGDKLMGRVDNDLVFEHSFKYNDKISFEKKNVMGMTTPDRV